MRIKGTIFLCTVALAISFIVLTVPVSADDDELCIPLGSWELDPPDGVDQKRSSVEFPHSTHFGYKCQQCHHTWSGEAEVLSCSTSGCHDQLATPVDEETGKADPEKAIQYYKKAYHGLCLGCHKEIKERNKELELSKEVLEEDLAKTGPTGCVKCHPKE
jgi:hypothetical protein